MVFRSKHYIACARFFKYIGPLIWIKHFCFEHRFKLFISKTASVIFIMKGHKIFLFLMQSISVPLRITITTIRHDRCISRHRIHTPMNKNAKLILMKPRRNFSSVQGFPIRLIILCICFSSECKN